MRKASVYKRDFNPRSPHGERRAGTRRLRKRNQFQSTLPARGATRITKTGSGHTSSFQSTLPARGATQREGRAQQAQPISIHAPRTGSDSERLLTESWMQISIHAPRTGSDSAIESAIDAAKDFNPRSPHGERLALCCDLRHNKKISIHAPRTGSDRVDVGALANPAISIHAPRTGSDVALRQQPCDRLRISIHAPRTGSDDSAAACP